MKIAELTEPLRAAASLFYPATCAVCGGAVERTDYLCAACARKVQRITAPFCAVCSEPFSGAIDQTFTCLNCAQRKLWFDTAVSACRSRGVVRFVMLQFKYNRQLHLRHLIRAWLLEALQDERLRGRTFSVIVPVPLHPARRRERGFNQAEVLARILSEHMKVPVQPALKRVRYTTTQTALERVDRIENLRDAFRLRRNAAVRDCAVLLVDDILTTGSTLSECARVLRQAGARSVHAVTAARA